ncbi:hypothetical protein [Streptomyces nitrosporeus]|uniref:hypothetical protein n=1 Tax=Streptomyces nitrosporeus TaxID=28894 RepID=UPI00123C9196|nr:hypothetical protein [Streptomyces nitrosporeus]
MEEPTGAVHLSDPMGPQYLEPAPDVDCRICCALARQRTEARACQDYSMISDCNVEINQHPHPRTITR